MWDLSHCCGPGFEPGSVQVGFCGGQSSAGVGFLRVLRFPLPIFIPPIAPKSILIYQRGLYNRPKWPQYQGLRCLGTPSHPTNNTKNMWDLPPIIQKICEIWISQGGNHTTVLSSKMWYSVWYFLYVTFRTDFMIPSSWQNSNHTVTCYATEDAVLMGNWFYYNLHQS
jgi:hypothetical protein